MLEAQLPRKLHHFWFFKTFFTFFTFVIPFYVGSWSVAFRFRCAKSSGSCLSGSGFVSGSTTLQTGNDSSWIKNQKYGSVFLWIERRHGHFRNRRLRRPLRLNRPAAKKNVLWSATVRCARCRWSCWRAAASPLTHTSPTVRTGHSPRTGSVISTQIRIRSSIWRC